MSVDKDIIQNAYLDVRADSSQTQWAAFFYMDDGKTIGNCETGTSYEDFLNLLSDDKRVYGYVRFESGDEMSRRARFVFITWIGSALSPLKKAKVSTDKAFVKNICNNFSVEILESDKGQLSQNAVLDLLNKAGGANYGTGVRD